VTRGAHGSSVESMPGRPRLRAPLPSSVTALVHEWSVASVQGARRNALVANTACARRRAERQEVADYLAARAGASTPDTSAVAEAVEPEVRRAAHR